MTQIVFYTPTILPKACLFTMGVSVKETAEPIGFFGTGLKYAIAVCMRLGASIEITSNNEHISFTTVAEDVRGKQFEVIYAHIKHGVSSFDEQRMPMTIDYGKTWEPWMALRELHSNTLDENGEMWDATDGKEMGWPHHPRSKNGTYIIVTCEPGSDLESAWIDRYGTWLLNPRRTPVWANENLQIFLQPASALFYRGIRVSQKGFESAVTYNILKKKTLTEDRTIDIFDFTYHHQWDIIKVESRDVASRILQASGNEKMVESQIYLNHIHSSDASIAMREEALRLYRVDKNMISKTAQDAMTRYVREHHFDELYTAVPLTTEQTTKHDACLKLLDAHGFHLSKYRTRWCEMSDTTLGMADSNTNTILLNIKLMNMQNWHEQICITMMEEYIHLEHEADDYTRSFQTKVLELLYDVMIKRPARAGGMLAGLAKVAAGDK